MEIRQATAADAERIVEWNAAIATETEGVELDRARLAAGVRAALEDPRRGTYYLAEDNGEALGQLAICAEWSDWRNGWFWWIESVYVAAAARRRGVYRALHDHVLHLAQERADVCGIRLYVDEHNQVAQRTYAAMGMQPARYRLFEVDFVVAR